MNKLIKQLVILTALATITPLAHAESNSATGAANLSTNARLNLRVSIPRFLHFRVGTVGGTIDQILFAPTDAEVGDSNPIAGTGGDAGTGSGANVSVRSNGGQITITETNDGGTGGLGTGAGNISLAEIGVISNNTDLDTPVLSDAGGNTSTPTLNGGSVTNRAAIWTYSYLNTTTPDGGDYDAEITYTAANF